jgi:uncharacterized protein YbbC (DUF1343 family)/CubicO group peptidase (beta-lactamase class C family)
VKIPFNLWRIFLSLLVFMFMSPSAFSQVLTERQLAPISGVIRKTIQAGKIPGAVIVVGHQGKIVYRQAFGFRALKPKKLPMTVDAIFDVASLTKVIATSTAIAQLIEMEKLNLEDPVAKYWPEFKANGKEGITVRELLTHYSGLRPALESKSGWSGYDIALRMIEEEIPIFPHGTRFLYSDINFVILAELVSRITGERFDRYCAEHIFKPLGMTETGFDPPPGLRSRIAPTLYQQRTGGKILWGKVHDPIAGAMGGVAGHAGLFSTADDLSIFARMILDRGRREDVQILGPLMVEEMTLPQSPANKIPVRGLGWNIDSSLASGSFGHTGFTGTGIWIDPASGTFVIILTNRLHPDGKGKVEPLRTEVLSLVSEAIGGDGRRSVSHHNGQGTDLKVRTGIDVLAAERFNPLKGLRVGLITNHSGIDSTGKRTIDLFHRSKALKLAAIFSPEHGFSGKAEGKVSSTQEALTGVPIHSLYGTRLRPTPKMLAGLDALVFDIQDAGARFYTYITTMGYAMEACAKKGIPFYVLDRPNPISASFVQGPLLDSDLKSFTGYFPLPVRHGMTVGELAKMFDAEKKMGLKLQVIKMRGYERSQWYDETGLPWISPSPNLNTLTQAILYPGVALVEGANVSVGRGTATPFEILGAPWINAEELASYLNNRRIQGVTFLPVDFTPSGSAFQDERCHGVRIVLRDRQTLDAPALGIEIASALYRVYPEHFQIDKTLGMIGSREVLQAMKDGQEPAAIVQGWQKSIEGFCLLRSKYLLY